MRFVFALLCCSSLTALGQAVQLADLNTTPAGSQVRHLSAAEGRAFFTAVNALGGREPFTSNGVATGRIVDFTTGPDSSTIDWTYAVSSTRAYLKLNGALTTTNGTTVSVLLPDVVQPLGHAGSVFYFTRGSSTALELWRSDGTAGGTASISVPASTALIAGGVVGSRFYFFRNGTSLWRTDGSTATQLSTVGTADEVMFASSSTTGIVGMGGGVFRFNPVTEQLTALGAFVDARSAVMLGDTAYFFGNNGVTGLELWRLLPGGAPTLSREFTTGSQSTQLSNLVVSNGRAFVRTGGSSQNLWATDTTAFTLLGSFSTSVALGPIALPGANRVMMVADQTLVITDGTTAGTTTVALGQRPIALVGADTNAYLVGSDGDLWLVTTTGTTTRLTFTYSGTLPTTVTTWLANADESRGFIGGGGGVLITGAPGEVFFTSGLTPVASRGPGFLVSFFSEARLLGPDGGVAALADITPSQATQFGAAIDLGPVTLFTANAFGSTDRELYRTDGTFGGTTRLLDLNPGSSSSNITAFAARAGLAWFPADDGVSGQELWVSDGTVMGTRRVADVVPGLASSSPSNLTTVFDGLLFTAVTPTTGREVWFSDGTAAGTVQLVDSNAGAGDGVDGSFAGFCEAAGLGAFFVANGTLYRTNGTSAGTTMVGPAPDQFACTPDRLVTLRDGGVETFDGTATRGLTPTGVSNGFRALGLTTEGTSLFVHARTTFYGRELWKSALVDGGVGLVADIAPFNQSGVNDLRTLRLRDRLVFLAANDGIDTEPWVHPLDGTRPTITPSVMGPQGLSGWYTGDVTVSFVVTEPESRLVQVGCSPLVITTDTPARTVTCRAFSEGGEATSAVTIKRDSTAPAAPTITAPMASAATNQRRPVMSASTSEAGTMTVRAGGQAVCTVVATMAGPQTCTPTSDLPAGPTTLSFTLTDEAGNVSTPSTTSVEVDLTAPQPPTITRPANGDTRNTIDVGGTAEPGATVTVFDSANQQVCTATANASGDFGCVASAPGADRTVTLEAKQDDRAGNASARSTPVTFTLDTTAPLAPTLTAPMALALLGTATPLVQGTAEAGARVQIFFDGAPTAACEAPVMLGTFSCQPTTPLTDGGHSVVAIARDAASNASAPSNPVTFTVSTSRPMVPVLLAPTEGSTLASSRPTFSGTSDAAQVRLIVDQASTPTCVATPSLGAFSCSATSPLSEGPHTVVAIAVSPAMLESAPSATVRFTLDATPPAAPLFLTPMAAGTTGLRPAFTGTAEAGVTVSVFIDAATQAACTATASATGTWSCVMMADLSPGQHTAQGRARDAAGNDSPPSGVLLFTTQSSIDTRAPELTCPNDIEAQATASGSAIVNFQATVRDDVDPAPALRYSQAPGTDYLEGDTTVVVTATDASGNTAQCGFVIKVVPSSERNTVRTGCRCSGTGADAFLFLSGLLWLATRRRTPRAPRLDPLEPT
ncbi:MAG: Ig-like domain-containing protein [Myxococcaceae bacterium]